MELLTSEPRKHIIHSKYKLVKATNEKFTEKQIAMFIKIRKVAKIYF
jgi:hypothetical protein